VRNRPFFVHNPPRIVHNQPDFMVSSVSNSALQPRISYLALTYCQAAGKRGNLYRNLYLVAWII